MAPTRRQLLASMPIAAIIAGCIGDDDDEDETTPTPTPTPSPTSTPTPTPTPVPEHTIDTDVHPELGEIVVDTEGWVLYMFDQDEQGAGESACYGDCADAWPPLIVDDEPTGSDAITAELTTFERDDGSLQVALDGWPLYYYIGDENPGEANGQGVNDVWWVLRGDGSVVTDEDDDDNGNGGGY